MSILWFFLFICEAALSTIPGYIYIWTNLGVAPCDFIIWLQVEQEKAMLLLDKCDGTHDVCYCWKCSCLFDQRWEIRSSSGEFVFSSHQCIAITSCAHFKIGCSQLSNEKKKCPLFFTKFEKKPLWSYKKSFLEREREREV